MPDAVIFNNEIFDKVSIKRRRVNTLKTDYNIILVDTKKCGIRRGSGLSGYLDL